MSVTAVPLRPITRGALTKLWIGLALLVGIGAFVAIAGTGGEKLALKGSPEAFLAWNKGQDGVVTTASGLQYKVLEPGEGARPTDADVALIGYEGRLADGTVFDSNPQAPLPVAQVVPGFSEGLKQMQRGGKYRLWIPPALGYGPQSPAPQIPANALLIFDVTLLDFRSQAELEAQRRIMEQQGGIPGGVPGGIPGN